MNEQHATRRELSRHESWYAARTWAIEHQYPPSAPGAATPYQIRKHPGYYAVVERVTAKK